MGGRYPNNLFEVSALRLSLPLGTQLAGPKYFLCLMRRFARTFQLSA
jgi:hypothetical protein